MPEKKIEELLLSCRWIGEPYMYYSGVNTMEEDKAAMTKIHELIQKAPLELCLASPSEYIREYRQWYDNKKTQ